MDDKTRQKKQTQNLIYNNEKENKIRNPYTNNAENLISTGMIYDSIKIRPPEYRKSRQILNVLI